MSATRLGVTLFLLGLIMLPFSLKGLSPKVGMSYGSIKPKETQYYIILAPPVGEVNLTIGEGMFERVEGIQLLIKVVSPNEEILTELNLITPYSFTVCFDQRGAYKVYFANQGDKESSVPLTIEFYGGLSNIEKDKIFVNEILLAVGVTFILLGILFKRVKSKGRFVTNST